MRSIFRMKDGARRLEMVKKPGLKAKEKELKL